MVVAGDWQALEIGRRWRMVGAGEYWALENVRRWRMAGVGEGKRLENFVLQPLLCQKGPKKAGSCHE
jgi:hypothetical protein